MTSQKFIPIELKLTTLKIIKDGDQYNIRTKSESDTSFKPYGISKEDMPKE